MAVDESAAMLAHVSQATPVHARIESLNLDRRFELVLLLSHLIDSETAPAMLTTASRHLSDTGIILIERPEAGRTWQPGLTQVGQVTVE